MTTRLHQRPAAVAMVVRQGKGATLEFVLNVRLAISKMSLETSHARNVLATSTKINQEQPIAYDAWKERRLILPAPANARRAVVMMATRLHQHLVMSTAKLLGARAPWDVPGPSKLRHLKVDVAKHVLQSHPRVKWDKMSALSHNVQQQTRQQFKKLRADALRRTYSSAVLACSAGATTHAMPKRGVLKYLFWSSRRSWMV